MTVLGRAVDALVVYVALYPIVSAAISIAGGIVFFWLEERRPAKVNPSGRWPPVSVLIPAFNEGPMIADAVRAALAVDYPQFEVLVLDDGSSDGTAELAREAGGGDSRLKVLRESQNQGKAEALNRGLSEARGPLVLAIDADAQIHPAALRMLVARIERSPRIAAVAGDPRVTNRIGILAALQTLEFSSVVGLIRRTQALSGTVGTVAGIVGLFRRDAVLAVGGYDDRMATEDIELTYRLLLAGWHTEYEPRALIGMRVPTTLRTLWRQRRRWARGQGEVLRVHGGEFARWANRGIWGISGEAFASLVWINAAALLAVLGVVAWVGGAPSWVDQFVPGWGVSVALVGTMQLAVALIIERHLDHGAARAFVLGPLYPAAYWMLNAFAAFTSQVPAFLRGPRVARVSWDMPRETSVRKPSGKRSTHTEAPRS